VARDASLEELTGLSTVFGLPRGQVCERLRAMRCKGVGLELLHYRDDYLIYYLRGQLYRTQKSATPMDWCSASGQ